MRVAPLLSLILSGAGLFAASGGFAQAPAGASQPRSSSDSTGVIAPQMVLVPSSNSAGCPVSLSAARQGRAAEWQAADYTQPDGWVTFPGQRSPSSAHTPPTGQGLEVRLGGWRGQAVVAATVVVHGWSGPGSVLLGVSDSKTTGPARGRREAAKSFHLQSGADDAGLTHARLWTTGLTAVDWLEVTQLTYADGAEWHSGSSQHCHVTPSLLELVATSR